MTQNKTFRETVKDAMPDIVAASRLIYLSVPIENFESFDEDEITYQRIKEMMTRFECHVGSLDPVCIRAYNALHSLYWFDTPAPANKPQLMVMDEN